MQPINHYLRYTNLRKRCYSSVYSLDEDSSSFSLHKKKRPKLASSFNFLDSFGKENVLDSSFNKSIDYHLHQISKNFKEMKIEDNQHLRKCNLTVDSCIEDDANAEAEDFEMFPSKMQNYTVDLSWRLEDFNLDCDETQSSSVNFENDIPDISKNGKITGKIIANALESEKTLNRIFEMNPKLIPNDRNGLVLYDKMKEYKEKFEREMFILHCRVNGLGLGLNYNMNDTLDDYSMDMVLDSNTLYEFFDDDMVID